MAVDIAAELDAELAKEKVHGPGTIVSLGTVTGLSWWGWSFWLMTSSKSPATIFGLVVVCLILLAFTISWALDLCTFVCIVVMLPFVVFYLVYGIIAVFVEVILLLLSPLCFINLRPGPEQSSDSNYCRLCQTCDALVEGFPLLLGSPWIQTRYVEDHPFYSESELRKSASSCHLRQLLFYSIFKAPGDNMVPHGSPPTENIRSHSTNEAIVKNGDG
jgi:hypothetical protein